jgi:hypothetical protein
MLSELYKLLQVLEDNVDSGVQQKIVACHKRALNWEQTDRLPLVIAYSYPKSAPFVPFAHREIFTHPEKMLFNELLHAFDTGIFLHPTVKDDLPYTIRANFGTVLVASLLGGRVEQRDDSPPWVRHFETEEEFLSIFEHENIFYTGGFEHENILYSGGMAGRVFDTYQVYRDILTDYPNLCKNLNIVLPDLQGPLDTLELLRGSDVYMDFLVNPEMTDKALSFIANIQVAFAKALSPLVSSNYAGYSFQHAVLIKGNILIRNDSAIMIDSEMYREQVAPCDEFVLNAMGGGGVHSCGRIDFNIPEILNLPSISCFDFGQSYLNDVASVYALAAEKKIPLIRIRPDRELLLSTKLREYYPTGVSLVYEASSYEEACHVSKKYSNMYGSNF